MSHDTKKNLALIFICLSGYFACLFFDYVYFDDHIYILRNSFLLRGDFLHFFTSPFSHDYTPLTLVSLVWDWKLGNGSPFTFHLTNVLLHVINTVLVHRFFRLIPPQENLLPFIAAAFFAIHPLGIESVAWISERKDLLYTFFYLIGLIVYLLPHSPKTKYLLPTLMLLSCLSKGMAITFPLALLGLDFLKGQFNRKLFLSKWPLFIISLAFSLYHLSLRAHMKTAVAPEGLTEYLAFAIKSITFYLGRPLLPFNLSAYYPAGAVDFQWPDLIGTLLIISLVIISYLKKPHLRRLIIFSLGVYFISLAPVLKIIPFGKDFLYANRYTYLPKALLIFLVIVLVNEYIKKRRILVILSSTIFIFHATIFAQWLPAWKNTETLWEKVLNRYPNTDIALKGYGVYLFDQGNFERAEKLMLRSFQLDPKNPETLANLGTVYIQKNNFAKADTFFRRTLELVPNHSLALDGLGIVLCRNDYQAALGLFNQALKLEPENINFYHDLTLCHTYHNKLDAAKMTLEKAFKINQLSVPTLNLYAGVLKRQKNYKAAISIYQKSIQLAPRNFVAYNNLGNLYIELNELPKARQLLEQALQLAPEHPTIKANLQKLAQ